VQENTGAGYPGDAGVTDDFDLAGVPDAFQRLWTPHRMAYIKGGQHQFKNENDCPFCVGPGRTDEEALIVYRGKTCYVVLNLFPYNPGHLLVCPYRHIPDCGKWPTRAVSTWA
jgi:ATP adenylyltransferase